MGSEVSGTASPVGADAHANATAGVERPLKVAIIVLNFQRYDETAGCLESLRSLRHPATVYLVDNASQEPSLAALARRFPEVSCLPLAQNEGFAGGMNHGIRRALQEDATHCLLLNDNARVTPPLLEQLLALYGAQKECRDRRAVLTRPSAQSAGAVGRHRRQPVHGTGAAPRGRSPSRSPLSVSV